MYYKICKNCYLKQARNFLRDQMKLGQSCFFYHSNCKEPGIAGICEVNNLRQSHLKIEIDIETSI